MTFNKIRERTGEIAHLQVAAPAQLVSDIFENVIRPTQGGSLSGCGVRSGRVGSGAAPQALQA
ncbi:hypothetical protein, partial [Bradyrhizobium sp. AUGA SZCCT0182]|uniref:hypothetical protein n=1 Tax=Bradyrhizobium sp. AUGA SZCCT0182 TaxID=2807667 RepID=UPI001BA51665